MTTAIYTPHIFLKLAEYAFCSADGAEGDQYRGTSGSTLKFTVAGPIENKIGNDALEGTTWSIRDSNSDGVLDADDSGDHVAPDNQPNMAGRHLRFTGYTFNIDGERHPVWLTPTGQYWMSLGQQGTHFVDGFALKDMVIGAGGKTPRDQNGELIPEVSNPYNPRETVAALCFLAGARIETDRGEIPVESLGVGDRVRTRDGARVPIKWIGRQRVPRWALACGLARPPVAIERGALGDNLMPVPHSDLHVSEDHAILIDGLLVQAGALTGQKGVRRMPFMALPATFTYYHVETERHEVILANGAPVESFVDNAPRDAFDNHAEYAALHGTAPPEMRELPFPRAMSRRQLPESTRTRFTGRGAPPRR